VVCLPALPCSVVKLWALGRPHTSRRLARSGTPLFVSFPRHTVKPDQEPAFRAALSAAARPPPLGEPLDWLDTRTPSHWRLGTEAVTFSW
jgi:alpha-galactosidase